MASKKIPKLVIKRHQTRKMEIPGEGKPEVASGQDLARTARLTRRTVVLRQAKNSLRSNAHLLAIGLLAMIVMYGLVATLTAEEAKTASITEEEEMAGPTSTIPELSSDDATTIVREDGTSEMWICVNAEKKLYKKITTGEEGTKTQLYKKIEPHPGAAIYTKYKPEKPKEVVPTDKQDGITRYSQGTIPQ